MIETAVGLREMPFGQGYDRAANIDLFLVQYFFYARMRCVGRAEEEIHVVDAALKG